MTVFSQSDLGPGNLEALCRWRGTVFTEMPELPILRARGGAPSPQLMRASVECPIDPARKDHG
jgi:hypothetical protein